jgi:hypothetical protein
MLSKELLDEIFRAFIHQKSNATPALLRGLAGVTGQSVANLKAHYVRCYQKTEGNTRLAPQLPHDDDAGKRWDTPARQSMTLSLCVASATYLEK